MDFFPFHKMNLMSFQAFASPVLELGGGFEYPHAGFSARETRANAAARETSAMSAKCLHLQLFKHQEAYRRLYHTSVSLRGETIPLMTLIALIYLPKDLLAKGSNYQRIKNAGRFAP